MQPAPAALHRSPAGSAATGHGGRSLRTSRDEQTAVRAEPRDLRIERLLLRLSAVLALILGECRAFIAVPRVDARLRRRTGAELQLTVASFQLGESPALLLLENLPITLHSFLSCGDLLSARLDRLTDSGKLREQRSEEHTSALQSRSIPSSRL